MNSKIRFFFILYPFFFLGACHTYVPRELPACTIETRLPGPYDLDLEDYGRNSFLIVSSQERRKRDPNGEMMEAGGIYRIGTPVTPDSRVVRYTIQGRDEYPFHPSGISVYNNRKERYLYLINTPVAGTNVIEVYRMKNEALVFVARIRSPLLQNPSDLVAIGQDDLYIVNHQQSLWSWLPGSFAYMDRPVVLHYKSGSWSVAVESIAGARGVAINQKGNLLAVSSEEERKVYIYSISADGKLSGPVRVVETTGMPELLQGGEGDTFLVAVNPDGSVLQKNRKTPNVALPAEIYRMDASNGKMDRIYGNGGDAIRAISSVLRSNGRIYAGQFFDSGLLQCGEGGTNTGTGR